jgi:hypothetical protein
VDLNHELVYETLLTSSVPTKKDWGRAMITRALKVTQRSQKKSHHSFRRTPFLLLPFPFLVLIALASCGPELKTSQSKTPEKAPGATDPSNKDSLSKGSQKTLLSKVEAALLLRSFDAADWDDLNSAQSTEALGALEEMSAFEALSAVESAPSSPLNETRTCTQVADLGITSVWRQWTGNFLNTKFLSENGTQSFRSETWSRPNPIACSEEGWAKVGWQNSSNLSGLSQKVSLQVNVARASGTRTTETFTSGERFFSYSPEAFRSVGPGEISFQRTLVIGSPTLKNAVRVVLKENDVELRRTTGFVHTSPDAPIVEQVVRSLGDKPSVLGRTIESGKLITDQPDGTQVVTTVDKLVYKGRRSNGTFSCVPTSGSITDTVSFSSGERIIVRREIESEGLTLTTRCEKGISVEVCSDLIQKSLRKSLTPFCLY